MAPFTLPLLLLPALGGTALPVHAPRTYVSSVTAMTSGQLSALAPYTQFARAAYCPPSIVQGWTCGRVFIVCTKIHPSHPLQEACQAVPDFHVSLTGGDGDAIQYCENNSPFLLLFSYNSPRDYVGYWPSSNSVVVAHQGTDPAQL